MKKFFNLTILLLASLVILYTCSNLNQLGQTEFADAITNAINATNGNIQTDIVLDSPTNGQTITNYTFTASGFAISAGNINQVFVFIRKGTDPYSTYAAALQDTGTTLRPFSASVTVTTNSVYDMFAQVHDSAGNVVNTPVIQVTVNGNGSLPTYPEIAVYKNSTLIPSNGSYTNDFGTLTKNSVSTYVTITISNVGNGTLRVTNVVDNSSQFTNTAGVNFNIGAHGAGTFQIAYTPNTAATHIANLIIYNNDSDEGSYRFVLKGTATNSTTPTPNLKVYWGSTNINAGLTYTNNFGGTMTNHTSAAHTFILSNAGTAPLTISNITDNSGLFTSQNMAATLNAGSWTNFTISFTPTNTGWKYATISIANTVNNPFNFVVKGLGTNAAATPQPEIAVYYNGTSITSGIYTNNFGSFLTNQSSAQKTFVISNLGSADLNIYSTVDNSSQFTTANLITTIGVGSAASFNISFLSAVAGTYHSTITINNDDANESLFQFTAKATATNASSSGKLTMTIDGTKEANWDNAFKISGSSTSAPLNITNLYVANDSTNLYLAFEADNPVSDWNRNVMIWYQIDDTLSAGTPAITETHFASGDTWSSSWKPTGSIFFKIGKDESWKGTFAHKVNAGGTGWDNVIAGNTGNHGISTSFKFVEGKFSLSGLNLTTGKTIKFYVVLTHQWNEVSEMTLPQTYVPDTDVNNVQNHTPVTWTANYTVK